MRLLRIDGHRFTKRIEDRKMKQSVNPEPKQRRKYDRVFKEEAVRGWLASGKSAGIYGPEIGVNPNCLYNWRKALGFNALPAAAASPADLAVENAALRRELDRVRQQRDILKKTLGIISEVPNSASPGSTR
jgi:transposase